VFRGKQVFPEGVVGKRDVFEVEQAGLFQGHLAHDFACGVDAVGFQDDYDAGAILPEVDFPHDIGFDAGPGLSGFGFQMGQVIVEGDAFFGNVENEDAHGVFSCM
jgi:hypothetical protein